MDSNKGENSPSWKGGPEFYGKRAYAKLKKDPIRMANYKRKRREWEANKRKNDPIWVEECCRRKRNEMATLRVQVINHYGSRCLCCGEDTLEFLCLDHVDGGGNEHRRQIGSSDGRAVYKWVRRNNYPDGFRILCHNCNHSLGAYGYCPHNNLTERVIL